MAKKLERLNKDIIICVAGPSLEDDIELIHKEKEKGCAVLAVSSGFAALTHHGIMPDMVITTDGGNWARFHLYEIVRECSTCNKELPLIIACAHAMLLSQFDNFPLLLFSDGSEEQNAALSGAKIPPYALPSRGTVSASAIDFAIAINTIDGGDGGNIYLSGLDLKNLDIKSHARPYAFDALLYNSATRFDPYYSLQYKRMVLFSDVSFSIYREWFKNEWQKYPRVFYLRDKFSNNRVLQAAQGTV